MDKKRLLGLLLNVLSWFTMLCLGLFGGYLIGVVSSGGRIGNFMPTPVSSLPDSMDEATKTELDTLFAPFWQTWELIHRDYVDQPVDNEKLMQGAIRGMIASLGDQHSSYMDPAQYSDMTAQSRGDYEGIGVMVNTEGAYLTVSEIFKGSPAEKGGLLAGDQIIAVDGVDMTGVLPTLVRQKVLGPKGSDVVLTILRGTEETFDVTLQRATIVVPSIEAEMRPDGIAYIKIRTFGQKTGDDLNAELEKLLPQNPKGLIIDLRNNGGGLVTTAVQIGSTFIKEGVMLYERYSDGSQKSLDVTPGGLALDIPMVVLVNQFSASASELVAGALQDYDRATIVGTVTFGKGTVQELVPLANNEGAARITIAKWLTPKERSIHLKGITPDVLVEMTEEDMKANLDPQLDKAVEVLLGK